MADVLVVDNHDSFVHTLVGYLHELGATTTMIEADAVADPAAALAGVAAVLVSPGPVSYTHLTLPTNREV